MAIDVTRHRERDRRRRLRRVAYVLVPIAGWLWWRILSANPVSPGWPDLPPEMVFWLPGIVIIAILALVLIGPMLGNGRSPHTIFLPEQLDVGFADVAGLGPVLGEVKHTLDVFLNHERFRHEMGGSPRRGVLFEGPPGTGKTHIAKALAKEAGVPFLFVSSTAFQSMWYGATARKIRSFFREMRKIARREGGAIGFIEEIDAIATKRGGLDFSPLTLSTAGAGGRSVERVVNQGTGGVVNELLVQMQSFDDPPRSIKFRNGLKRFANRFLPQERWLKLTASPFANVLLIGATNRADSLDPALLRPGRFDRILHLGLPGRLQRRELIDYFLTTKSHHPELRQPAARETIAAATMGYSPAALERLFDEALLGALRAGRDSFTMADVRKAQMEVEIGLPNPVDYPADERRAIATHEAGHATTAYLVGKGRKLEVLSIVKRKDSLGLLAHRDDQERYTRGEHEMRTLLQIALGGMVAEELFFGESGTGPAGDLAGATSLAVQMVGAYGLGGSLISYQAVNSGPFGGDLTSKVIGDPAGRARVDAILDHAKAATTELLSEHRYLVEALRDALLEKEELVDQEILEVLRRAEAGALTTGATVVDLRETERPRVSRPESRIELLPDPTHHED